MNAIGLTVEQIASDIKQALDAISFPDIARVEQRNGDQVRITLRDGAEYQVSVKRIEPSKRKPMSDAEARFFMAGN